MDHHKTTDMGAHMEIMMTLFVQFVQEMKEVRQQNSHSENELPRIRDRNQQRDDLPGSRQITETRRPKSHFFVGIDRGPDTTNLVRIGLERGMQAALVTTQTEVRSLQNQVANLSTELEDNRLQIAVLQAASYDGTFVWKIPESRRRRREAQAGKTLSLYSAPFFTSRHGYQMCLRVYLNGDGTAENTHMSLFFVVMKGEFDNILQWPFTHKVTFKLINQTGGRDIVQTFQPNPMSSSFRKPRSEMNNASGFPRFAPLSTLERFVEDDCIFVKCIVDTTNIVL